MSADNRSVATDALATLGTIIGPNEKRDAIHLAVFPAQAGSNFGPGDHVKLEDGLAVHAYENDGIGIVDPFLNEENYRSAVKPGQWFWLILYPRQISSLRHVWSHPAFKDELDSTATAAVDAREESRKWLEEFAIRLFSYKPDYGTRFDVLIANAESGGFGTDIEYGEGREPNEEFWFHYERYTGRKVKNRPEYFRCAC